MVGIGRTSLGRLQVFLACLLSVAGKSIDKSYVIHYEAGDHSHTQMGDAGLAVSGYYSYKDDSGQVHRVDYIADDKGYRVVGGNGPVATTSTLDGSQAVLAATETPRKPTTVSQPAASDNRMTDEPATLMVPAVEGTTASVDATSRNASQPDQGAVDAVADVGSDKSTLPEAAPMYLLLVAGGRPAEAAESGRKPTLASPAVFYLAPLRWLMVNQKAEMKVGVPTRLAVPVSYLKNGPFGFTIPYAP